VYEPEPVKVKIVSLPLVVTVGEPDVVPEYLVVSIRSITIPEPPAPEPPLLKVPAPPPEPVLAPALPPITLHSQ